MSFELWQELPEGFLQKAFKHFCKLDRGVQRLIVELAREQKFKCALCDRSRKLLVEHDHDPEEGFGVSYTVYNIRGLVCHRRKQALRGYEIDERGEISNWEHGYPYISSHDYEDYIYAYRCRVYPLNQEAHERRASCRNPWHRRRVLEKFDAWFYEESEAPPRWYERYKEEQRGRFETPEDFIRGLDVAIQFFKEQIDKNPNFCPTR